MRHGILAGVKESRRHWNAAAAAVLLQEGHEEAVYDITGSERYTAEALAALYGELGGRSVEARRVDDTAFVAGLVGNATADDHLRYGAELLAFLERRGDAVRLRPWVEALRALHLGDRRALQNVAPEIRTTAEELFDEIEQRLKTLPDKTRRRPLPEVKERRTRRARRM